MPESGPLGSERGAASNGRPYRETLEDASLHILMSSKPEALAISGIGLSGARITGQTATGV